MKFEEKYISKVKTPILVPEHYKLLDVHKGRIHYQDIKTGEKHNDEPLFLHDKQKIFFNQFRTLFPNDSVIVLLFTPEGKLFLHRRAQSKKWEPNKIDLASVAGQRRALLVGKDFQNEEINETALREISEESGVERKKLSLKNLHLLGIHHNPHTDEYQTIFAYVLDVSLKKLNENIKKHESHEVAEWLEQEYEQTMREYFGKEVNKYAGGVKMRPVNFISNPVLKKALDDFKINLKD